MPKNVKKAKITARYCLKRTIDILKENPGNLVPMVAVPPVRLGEVISHRLVRFIIVTEYWLHCEGNIHYVFLFWE